MRSMILLAPGSVSTPPRILPSSLRAVPIPLTSLVSKLFWNARALSAARSSMIEAVVLESTRLTKLARLRSRCPEISRAAFRAPSKRTPPMSGAYAANPGLATGLFAP